MSLFLLSLIFFLGACMGSFGAVLIENEGIKRSFWSGRSQCLSCKKTLHWYELIPLDSYAIQKGRCRGCGAKIPRWIWYTEWYMAFLWMVSVMILDFAGLSPLAIAMHVVILTGLSLIVIGDIRSRIIPDTLSMPFIVMLVIIQGILFYYPTKTFLPFPEIAVFGAFIGMIFYMLQMILPATGEILKRKTFSDLATLFLSPLLFPAWMITKAFVGEERADKRFPSLAIFEDLPSWVGGGDIRLGFIIGAIVGPYDFLYVIMYGYVFGTVYFLFQLLSTGKKMETMPVAPLLFVGIIVLWCSKIFA